MKALRIMCPSSVTDKSLRKLEHYYGIEFERGASNGGGENGYHAMIGDEELLKNLTFHNLIQIGLVKNGVKQATFNQTNWNKTKEGASVSLAGDDGSDVMQTFPTLYAIIGGTNSIYERYIISDEPFSYDGDEAEEIHPYAETPDFEVIVSNVARSIYNPTIAGTQGTTRLTNISAEGDYVNANGYPSGSKSRYGFESAARAKNDNTLLNVPYANASTLDLELIMALLYIECRTKNLNSVFGHGISSNASPSESTWGTVSGCRVKNGDAWTYLRFNSNVYISGEAVSMWSAINGQTSLLKIFEAQRAVSDDGTLEGVTNSDGEALQGLSDGVMTGIYTKTFTAKLTCALTSGGEVTERDVEVVLRVPVWRGRTRLWGNIWQHLSGYDVLNYQDGEGVVHNDLYRAKSIADMTTDTDEAAKDSANEFAFVTKYEKIGDLGNTSGWMRDCLSTAKGRTVLPGVNTGAAINNYQSAYTNLDSEATAGKYRRKTAGFFGGYANYSYDVLRYCHAFNAPSSSHTAFGSGFRVELSE